MSRIRVVLVDDHRVVARSLQRYLESFPDMEVVGVAASGEDLLRHLVHWNPQIVNPGPAAPRRNRWRRDHAAGPRDCAPVRVIALTASTDEARMTGVLEASGRRSA